MIGAYKLTEERAEVIKALLKGGEHTHQQIADLAQDLWGISISRELVTSINKGRRWNDDIRSFEMRDGEMVKKPKTGNDFREFGPPPVKRFLTDRDMEVIKSLIDKQVQNDQR